MDCGGEPDGHSLCCWLVQVHVKENHQNGKDTHIRGIKIFAFDENSIQGAMGSAVVALETQLDNAADMAVTETRLGNMDENHADVQRLLDSLRAVQDDADGSAATGVMSAFSGIPDYMREPEIR